MRLVRLAAVSPECAAGEQAGHRALRAVFPLADSSGDRHRCGTIAGSVRLECSARIVPLGETHLRTAVHTFVDHYR